MHTALGTFKHASTNSTEEVAGRFETLPSVLRVTAIVCMAVLKFLSRVAAVCMLRAAAVFQFMYVYETAAVMLQ
jgi:hypothetical protein